MILRPRQEIFVARGLAMLEASGNGLGMAPTGFGKTVSFSSIIHRRMLQLSTRLQRRPRALILQHRDQLVDQNRATFAAVAPELRTSVIDAKRKDPHGDVIFAMIQSCGEKTIPLLPEIDLIATDETHHSAAKTYRAIYDRFPDAERLGVTATSKRGDGKSLAPIYTGVFDVVTLTETIKAGSLVPPVAKIIDVGVQGELNALRKLGDGEQAEVEHILNSEIKTETIIRKWREHATDRSTVIFCSTVKHAQDVAEAYREAGISAACVEGKMSKSEKDAILRRFGTSEIQVITNVMVLTEGWDEPRVSCVIFLRVCSQHATMTQAIGRGLRLADPIKYPGLRKTDCIVLDFGISLRTHQTLEQEVSLDAEEKVVKLKVCPKCDSHVPAGVSLCGVCGHRFKLPPERTDRAALNLTELSDFEMATIEIVEASPFRWEPFWGGGMHMAGSFEAWACVAERSAGGWAAIGGCKDEGVRILEYGADSGQAFAAADEWMRLRGKRSECGKVKEWLSKQATPKQIEILGPDAHGMTRYRAMVALYWKFNAASIKEAIEGASSTMRLLVEPSGAPSSGEPLPTSP